MVWILAAGAAIGFAFDWYRTFRRWRRWGPVRTFIGDLMFSLLALFILVMFLQRANFLAFRVYAFVGVLVGLLFYGRMLSRWVTGGATWVYRLCEYLTDRFRQGLKAGLRLLTVLMRPFYATLRWASLLSYRMGEALVWERARIGHQKADNWRKRHFPPRTKG